MSVPVLVSTLVMPVRGDRFALVPSQHLFLDTRGKLRCNNEFYHFSVQDGDHFVIDDLGAWLFVYEQTIFVDETRERLAFEATWTNPSLKLPAERRRVRVDIAASGVSEIRFI